MSDALLEQGTFTVTLRAGIDTSLERRIESRQSFTLGCSSGIRWTSSAMLRHTLTILSLIGLLLSVGLWAVSVSGGFTHFYMGPDGEATGLAFICAGGRIGWTEATDMSRSLLRPDHGVPLWLPTVVLAGLFLFSIFQTFWERVVGSTMRGASRTVRRVGMALGLARAASTLRKKLTLLSLIGLLLSVGLWGASYMRMGTAWRRTRLALMNGSVHLGLFNRGGFMELEEPEDLDTPAELDFYSWPDFPYTKTWCMGFEDWRTYSWSFSYERWMYGVNIRCPLWMPCLLFAATPLYVFAARPLYYMIPFSRRRKCKKLGLCLKCGYDLRGSKVRCPECGGEFSATPTELVKVQSSQKTRFKTAVKAKLQSFGGFCVCVALCYVAYAGGTWIFGPPSAASLGYTVLRQWTAGL